MTASLRSLAPRIATLDTSAAKPPPKTADAFYLSRQWRALVAEIIAERGARCEDPMHDPRRPRVGVRIFGDHVHELKHNGAPLDKSNVMLRCGSCHTRKTVAMRAVRMAERIAPGENRVSAEPGGGRARSRDPFKTSASRGRPVYRRGS